MNKWLIIYSDASIITHNLACPPKPLQNLKSWNLANKPVFKCVNDDTNESQISHIFSKVKQNIQVNKGKYSQYEDKCTENRVLALVNS